MIRSVSRKLLFGGSSFRCNRLASTLAFVETNKEGSIVPSSLNALNAARGFNNDLVVVILGSNASKAASKLKSSIKCENLKKILVSTDEQFDNYLPEKVGPLLVNLLKDKEFTHFVTASSAVGKNVLPRIGALLDLQPICDITKIVDSKTFVRPIYAGNVISTVECTQAQKLIGIRASAFDPIAEGSSDTAVIEDIATVEGDSSSLQIEWENANLTESERPELSSASKVVAGGRALKDKATFEKLLTPLADVLHAGIGATRAAVDSGFCDNSLQIGQTGRVVAPDLYIAIGISGAIQHLAGMKDSKVIVAINNDPDAPIFKVADFGLQGDIYEIVPELTKKLEKL
ncbi:hypothetical protein HG535_0H01770 [Zygotorulaspora mrakii]|uniref:Probable electron transfer flavoprotein subunit alpha n=1 Tax=Zygotorulaspora mrakii TaxID=42260 RepID=A0A7H9B8T4_ZYGMR|nr:uncharacterized protein HG535_0H01770 [Zygotorulaspora mrakii]QLG74850.1 hypothetical protein HG535_0H01770 [Zygotorulaspora mrakii]